MNEEELTSYRRFRYNLHGGPNMVLQVEVSNWDYAAKKWVLSWRDAKPTDLTKQAGSEYYV